MRYLALAFLLSALRLSAAVGDLIGLEVETNGWVLRATIEGLNTNGNFFNGFATNNSITGTQKLTLTVLTPGRDVNGASQLVSRVVYGTKVLSRPYPMQNTNDIHPQGDGCVARIALSDWVFSGDTITASALAGWYATTNSLTNANAFTSQVVTNSSTNGFPLTVANWSCVPYQRWTSSTMRVSVVAFGPGARLGRPVNHVKFWATDGSNFTPTNTVYAPTIDRAAGDAVPVVEYIGVVDISSLTHSNQFMAHFEAVPWIGTNTVNTADGRYEFQTCFYAPQPHWNDRLNTLGTTVAVVSNSGNDTTGKAVDEADFSASTPPQPFLTLAAAASAIVRTNWLLHGRSSLSGGRLYLTNGVYDWVTGTPAITNFASTWFTVTAFPGLSPLDAVITNHSGAQHLGNMVKIEGVGVSKQTIRLFGATSNLWIDRCVFTNVTASRIIQNATNTYFTRNVVHSLPQNLATATDHPNRWWLIRGNNITTNAGTILGSTVLGNLRTGGNTAGVAINAHGGVSGAAYEYLMPIVAYNKFLSKNSGTDWINGWASPVSTNFFTNGAAIVQNVVEAVDSNPNAARIGSIASASNGGTNPDKDQDNIILWNNTFVGQRFNFGENASATDADSVAASRRFWSALNNIFEQINTKSDTEYSPSGKRLGNWPVKYGVGLFGNTDMQPTSMDVGWGWSFFGLSSHDSTNQTSYTGTREYFQFVDAQMGASDGGADYPGGGEYRLRSSSRLWFDGLETRWVLPFDIEGQPRSAIDPPGAYSAGNVRKGAFF